MEFLLNIRIDFSGDKKTLDQLVTEEHALAEKLKREGHLIRMWRTPCAFGNWGLWRAEDATQLHDLVSSLPLYPWMTVTVHALARHALDPAGAGEHVFARPG